MDDNNGNKVFSLKITRHGYDDGWRDGGPTVDVVTSNAVPLAELKNLARKFIVDVVNSANYKLVFRKEHVSTLKTMWEDTNVSAVDLVLFWNRAQPSAKIEIVSQNPFPPFPTNLKIRK